MEKGVFIPASSLPTKEPRVKKYDFNYCTINKTFLP